MPKISRPKSWEGYALIDVKEFARRAGRTENAIRLKVKRGHLKNHAGDARIMLNPADVECVRLGSPKFRQLRLLKG